MIAPIVHLREGTLELIEEMIGQVDLYLNAHASRIARILTKDTGWGGLGEGSVRVTRTSLGAPCISCGRPHDNLSLVLDEGLLTWNPRTERPTLEGIRELLVTIGMGRMRDDSDPIEILTRDLAVLTSQKPPERPRGMGPVMGGPPFVIVEAPGARAGSARIAWIGTMGQEENAGYRPSAGLQRRLDLLPTEMGVTHVRRSITCGTRRHHAAIETRDPIDTLRAMATTSLTGDQFMEHRP